MRIALIAPTYLPARRANTIQVMKMAQAITLLGHQVRVVVPDISRQGHRAHSAEGMAPADSAATAGPGGAGGAAGTAA